MGSSERNQRIQSSRTQTSNMKTLLLLSILGLALISADLQTEEDRYTEEADVVAVDDSAEAMDDLKDEMEDSRRKRKRPTRTYYRANFNANEPIAAPTDGVVTSPSSQQTQIESFNKQTAQIVYFAPNGENDVTGTVTASTTSAGELKFDWDLAGLEESTDVSGKNGIHIHYGKSCDNEDTVAEGAPTDTNEPADPALNANKGHYYNPATSYQNSDPWANVKYISDAAGKSTGSVKIPGSSTSEVSLGAADFSAFSRVVIVHNVDGTKRGCGVLAPSNTVKGTVDAYVTDVELCVAAGLSPDEIELIARWQTAREARQWDVSDRLRERLREKGLVSQIGNTLCELNLRHGDLDRHCLSRPPTPDVCTVEKKLKVDWDMKGLEKKIVPGIQRAKIESFNKQTAQIRFFEPNRGSTTAADQQVTGSVTASTTSDGELKLEWDLTGLPASTDTTGSNGIHIHYGTSCDSEATVQGDAPVVPGTTTPSAFKGHYYVPTNPNAALEATLGAEDPWSHVKYISDGDGKSTDFVTIPGFSTSGDPRLALGAADFSAFSRVVIVHNVAGKKIGCGLLAPSNTVMGTVTASTTNKGGIKLDWDLAGLPASTDTSGKNGIHVHYGTSCGSETTVKGDAPDGASKGHYYNPKPGIVDPWANVKWESDIDGKSTGRVKVTEDELGLAGLPDSLNWLHFSRVVIVHDPTTGAKIGCGVLAAPKNGIHIHYGTSCDSETTVKGDAPTDANKGHYYDPIEQSVDPWGPVKWESNRNGKSTGSAEFTEAQLGAPLESAFDRVVIVHNSFGTKVGCGVLSARRTRAKGVFNMKICNEGTQNPYARYKVYLKGDVADATDLNFHLHSAYTANAAAGTVGKSGTSGHYDPDFKCGGASSNQGTQACEDENAAFTYPGNGHERGDLSGKMGPVKVHRNKRFSKAMGGTNSNWEKGWSPKDTNPPLNAHFSDVGGSTTGAEFASVVFHKGSARVFGARLTFLHSD